MVGDLGDNLQTDPASTAPDPALLPDLSRALEHATLDDRVSKLRAGGDDCTPPRSSRTELALSTRGMARRQRRNRGLQPLITASTVPGDRIAVENPTAVRLLDLVDQRTDRAMAVACDSEGPTPDSLRKALEAKPAIFSYQPRAHNRCGHSLSKQRCAELAEIIQRSSPHHRGRWHRRHRHCTVTECWALSARTDDARAVVLEGIRPRPTHCHHRWTSRDPQPGSGCAQLRRSVDEPHSPEHRRLPPHRRHNDAD